MLLFPPNSGEKQKFQVTQSQRDAWDCPALTPEFGTSIPDHMPRGARWSRRELSRHTPDPREVVSSISPRTSLFTRDSLVEKLLSPYSRTTQRSFSSALEQRGGRTCRDGRSWHQPPPHPASHSNLVQGGQTRLLLLAWRAPVSLHPGVPPWGHTPFGMGRRGKISLYFS